MISFRLGLIILLTTGVMDAQARFQGIITGQLFLQNRACYVAGAKATVRVQGKTLPEYAITNDEGHYRIELPPRKWTRQEEPSLRFEKEGYFPVTVNPRCVKRKQEVCRADANIPQNYSTLRNLGKREQEQLNQIESGSCYPIFILPHHDLSTSTYRIQHVNELYSEILRFVRKNMRTLDLEEKIPESSKLSVTELNFEVGSEEAPKIGEIGQYLNAISMLYGSIIHEDNIPHITSKFQPITTPISFSNVEDINLDKLTEIEYIFERFASKSLTIFNKDHFIVKKSIYSILASIRIRQFELVVESRDLAKMEKMLGNFVIERNKFQNDYDKLSEMTGVGKTSQQEDLKFVLRALIGKYDILLKNLKLAIVQEGKTRLKGIRDADR